MKTKIIVREVISGLVGGAFFLLFLFVLDMNIWISVTAAVVVYIGMVLLFGPTRILGLELASLTGINPQLIADMTEQGYRTLQGIRAQAKKIPDGSPSKQVVERLCEATDQILANVRSNPRNYKTIRLFFASYLDRTASIIEIYTKLLNQNIRNPEVRQKLKEVEQMLLQIENAFEMQRKKLNENDIFDLVVDMKVLRSQLELEEQSSKSVLESTGGQTNE